MDKERDRLMNGYTAEKRSWDATFPWIYYVARPLSFPLTLLLRRLGATPDQITLFTALLGAFSFPALASGRPDWMIGGSAALLLYTIFDCVDGNLARSWPETASRAGKYWDGLVGNFYILSYFALGIGLGGEYCLLAGAGITSAKLLACRIKTDFWSLLGGNWEADKKVSGFTPHTGRPYYKLYYNLTDPQAHIFLLPVALIGGVGHWFLYASALITAGELLFSAALYLSRSARLK